MISLTSLKIPLNPFVSLPIILSLCIRKPKMVVRVTVKVTSTVPKSVINVNRGFN